MVGDGAGGGAEELVGLGQRRRSGGGRWGPLCNNMTVLSARALYTQKWLRQQIVCYMSLTTVKNPNRKLVLNAYSVPSTGDTAAKSKGGGSLSTRGSVWLQPLALHLHRCLLDKRPRLLRGLSLQPQGSQVLEGRGLHTALQHLNPTMPTTP